MRPDEALVTRLLEVLKARPPYVYGGASLTGMDCSGFVSFVWSGCRPRQTTSQMASEARMQWAGNEAELADRPRPGVYRYLTTWDGRTAHCGLLLVSAGKATSVEMSGSRSRPVLYAVRDVKQWAGVTRLQSGLWLAQLQGMSLARFVWEV